MSKLFIVEMLILTIFGTCALSAGAKDYVITDFGVTAKDSTKVQTQAIQAVIDRAESEGGGRIVVPKGTYLTGALFFKPGTKLHFNDGAVIKGSDNVTDFPLIPSRMEGKNIYYYAAVINAYFVDGFQITGKGTVNGNGYKYWVDFWERRERCKVETPDREFTNLEVHRPRLVFLWGCDNVLVSGVNLCNSAFWTTHLYQCTNVIIENCRITAPMEPVKAPSSDAIDIDWCSHVTVRGCYLDCNDDGVCVKGGKGVYANRSFENGMVDDILVEDCTFGPALHGVLTMGSECIHANKITMRNCKVDVGCSILRLKMRPDTYQIYENITVENITGRCGCVIEMKPWKQYFTLEGSDEKPYGQIKNVLIKNVDVTCSSLGVIDGNPGDTVIDFVMENITLKAKKNKFRAPYDGVTLRNVLINGAPPVK